MSPELYTRFVAKVHEMLLSPSQLLKTACYETLYLHAELQDALITITYLNEMLATQTYYQHPFAACDC